MTKKKIKIKKNKKKSNLAKIATFTAQSLSGAYNSYKKNLEQKKIEAIKLKKLEENNKVIKEKKELKIREDQLKKDYDKLKIKEEELKIREKNIKHKEEKHKTENDRLLKKRFSL